MKKLAFALFLMFLGALIVFTMPVLFAHNEDMLLMKINEMEAKIQEQAKQIQDLRSVIGLPHKDYPGK